VICLPQWFPHQMKCLGGLCERFTSAHLMSLFMSNCPFTLAIDIDHQHAVPFGGVLTVKSF